MLQNSTVEQLSSNVELELFGGNVWLAAPETNDYGSINKFNPNLILQIRKEDGWGR